MFNMVGLLPAASYSPSTRRHPRCIRPSPLDMTAPVSVPRRAWSLINWARRWHHLGIFVTFPCSVLRWTRVAVTAAIARSASAQYPVRCLCMGESPAAPSLSSRSMGRHPDRRLCAGRRD